MGGAVKGGKRDCLGQPWWQLVEDVGEGTKKLYI